MKTFTTDSRLKYHQSKRKTVEAKFQTTGFVKAAHIQTKLTKVEQRIASEHFNLACFLGNFSSRKLFVVNKLTICCLDTKSHSLHRGLLRLSLRTVPVYCHKSAFRWVKLHTRQRGPHGRSLTRFL